MAMLDKAIVVGSSPAMSRSKLNYPQWSIEKLEGELASSASHTRFAGDLIFLRCPDRGYWMHKALENGYRVRATHPICSWNALRELQLGSDHFGVYYEYVSPSVNFKEAFEEIGGVLYFEVRCSAADPLALDQVLLETLHWLRLHMESIDEVFARTRSFNGISARADCAMVYLKLANGIEGHCFLHALQSQVPCELTFYGRSGTVVWDGGVQDGGILQVETLSNVAATYRIADWVEKASRFERAMTYREVKKL